MASCNYSGLLDITMTDSQLADFYQGVFEEPILTNQYLIIRNTAGEVIDKYIYDGRGFARIKFKAIDNGFTNKIKPLNVRQELLFHLLQSGTKIPVKLIDGCFGVGKSFVALNWALEAVNKHDYDKVVYIRNNIEVKDTVSIGALPNGLNDKLLPFAMPIADIVGGLVGLEYLLKENKIEMAHLGFLRGRNFDNSVIFVTEAENLTEEHVKLILSRCGKNSVIIFDGDVEQVDKSVFADKSGMQLLINALKGNPLFGMVELIDVERSDVAKLSGVLSDYQKLSCARK
jgi:predicted ribonuclease YlaK